MLKHITTYFIGKIFPAIFSLFIILFGYRIFGEEVYGLYALLFSVVIVIHELTVGWIKQSVLRYLSTYDQESEPIHQIIRYSWLSSILSILIILLIGLFYFKLSFSGLVMGFGVCDSLQHLSSTPNNQPGTIQVQGFFMDGNHLCYIISDIYFDIGFLAEPKRL